MYLHINPFPSHKYRNEKIRDTDKNTREAIPVRHTITR
jgi:hypothetical protein